MKNVFYALSFCLTPVAAMADGLIYMFGVPDELSDYDSASFSHSIHALQETCMETEDPSVIAICDNSDEAIEAISDKYICFDVRHIPTKAFNDCQAEAVLSISMAIQYQFNQHILNDGEACEFNNEYQCFTTGNKVFAFRNQPA